MNNKKYKVFKELVVSNEDSIINALEHVKNLINDNINNVTINKLIIESYCSYCKDKVNSKIIIDFNKLIIKNKSDYTCKSPYAIKTKEKFKVNSLSNPLFKIEKSIESFTNNFYVQAFLYIGDIISIALSPYYSLEDFNYYKNGFKIIFKEVYKNKKDYIGIDIIFEGSEFDFGNPVVSHIIKLR